jgi:excisionase family DNA binding protein
MGRTKTPKPTTSGTNGAPGEHEILTLAEAATYLRVSEAEVLQAIEEQGLPGAQIGTTWRFLKIALQDWLRTGGGHATNKAAQLAVAGVWKDDPFWEDELRDIYKRRNKLAHEGEQ